jgi:DNA-binding transcriptional MerR regulator
MPELKGIRIGEVARRAGVPVSTVKHYYREGLLPEPILKRRNSAYYSDETVNRVKLIKELQETAFLPLKVVKEIFSRTTDPEEIKRYLRQPLTTEESQPEEKVNAQPYLDDGIVSREDLDGLAELGLVHLSDVDSVLYIQSSDAELLSILTKLRELGLNTDRGFRVDQLKLYQEHLARLARLELSMALEGLVGRMTVEDVQKVASRVTELATDLVAVIHRKEIRRILGEQSRRIQKRKK